MVDIVRRSVMTPDFSRRQLYGPSGPSGASGPPGADGISLLTVSEAPADTLGKDGDYAFNPSTSTLYGPRSGGVWPPGSALQGEAGPPGPSGPPGPQGDQGLVGPTGADGAAGSGGGGGGGGGGSDVDVYIPPPPPAASADVHLSMLVDPTIIGNDTNRSGVAFYPGYYAPAINNLWRVTYGYSSATGDFMGWPVLFDGGTYTASIAYVKFSEGGIWQLLIDGTAWGSPVDSFATSATAAIVQIQSIPMIFAGVHNVIFRTTGTNSQYGTKMAISDVVFTRTA